jgi:hypothetical protein
VSSWNATLNNINPDRLVANEARVAAQTKASAALVIVAIILDAASPLIALCLLNGTKKRQSYIVPSLSSLIAIAAGTLAVLSMRDGVHGILDTSEHGGPAIIILFVGAGLRLLSCAGAISRPDEPSGHPSRREPSGYPSRRESWGYPSPQVAGNQEFSHGALKPPGNPQLTRNNEIGLSGERQVCTNPLEFTPAPASN